MRGNKSIVKKISNVLRLPPQLQPGVPMIEMIGKNTVIISRYYGLTKFTAQSICANSSEGIIAVSGDQLRITQMNSETLTISGKISNVSFSEAQS